jgi:hypothetical protein
MHSRQQSNRQDAENAKKTRMEKQRWKASMDELGQVALEPRLLVPNFASCPSS